MYKTIIICAKERLCDKSCYVVKSAILLIKTLVKLNPYSCNVIIIKINNNNNNY